MIEVKNLVKRYGDHLAVDHLSFQLDKGKIYGFLGPNGAGKSTTMNMMTGYLSATEGEILIQGHDILKEPKEAKKHIGYLPELPPLYMEMTVWEYLNFAGELVGLSGKNRKEQVENVMELVKVSHVQQRLIRNLSKGYRQRVGLAQALLGYPDILILDEPMVGLDPQQIIEIRDLIRDLAKEHTVILSSHILAEVSELCDEILIISKGKLVASGTPEHLEEMMKGAGSLELLVKSTEKEAQEILKGLPGIQEMDCVSGREEGTVQISLQPEEGKDIREAVFWAFARGQKPLLSMETARRTLEDVFLEVTGGEEEQKDAGDL